MLLRSVIACILNTTTDSVTITLIFDTTLATFVPVAASPADSAVYTCSGMNGQTLRRAQATAAPSVTASVNFHVVFLPTLGENGVQFDQDYPHALLATLSQAVSNASASTPSGVLYSGLLQISSTLQFSAIGFSNTTLALPPSGGGGGGGTDNKSRDIGLGVGLGLGIPIVILIIVAVFYYRKPAAAPKPVAAAPPPSEAAAAGTSSESTRRLSGGATAPGSPAKAEPFTISNPMRSA